MSESQGARIVICSKHGIPYDASKRGGCARCIREWERQKAPGRQGTGFPTSIKLLGLLLVAGGAYFLLNRPPQDDAGAPAAPAAAPAQGAPSAAASADREVFERIVIQIPDLIEDGRRDTENLLADAGDPDRQRDDWEFWSTDWNGRVRQLTGQMPKRPDSREQLELALVYQDLSKALEELRFVPRTTVDGLPDAAAVRERFQAADKALEQARLHLSQVTR